MPTDLAQASIDFQGNSGRRSSHWVLAANQQRIDKARELLERHPHFHGRTEFIKIRSRGNGLVLSGILPSYFLKQLAQEAIRSLGTFEIDNQIVVTGMIGEMFRESAQAAALTSAKGEFRRKEFRRKAR